MSAASDHHVGNREYLQGKCWYNTQSCTYITVFIWSHGVLGLDWKAQVGWLWVPECSEHKPICAGPSAGTSEDDHEKDITMSFSAESEQEYQNPICIAQVR